MHSQLRQMAAMGMPGADILGHGLGALSSAMAAAAAAADDDIRRMSQRGCDLSKAYPLPTMHTHTATVKATYTDTDTDTGTATVSFEGAHRADIQSEPHLRRRRPRWRQ